MLDLACLLYIKMMKFKTEKQLRQPQVLFFIHIFALIDCNGETMYEISEQSDTAISNPQKL